MLGGNAFGWSYPGQGPFQASIPKSSSDSGTGTDVISGRVIVTPEPGQIGSYAQFPLAFSTYSGITSSFPSYGSILSGPAPLPQLTETAVIKFGLATTDVNGTTTESGSARVFVTGTDTGTGADSATVVAPISVTDAGGATETVALVAKFTATDTNAGISESASFIATVPSADVNGAVTESASLVAKITATDTN